MDYVVPGSTPTVVLAKHLTTGGMPRSRPRPGILATPWNSTNLPPGTLLSRPRPGILATPWNSTNLPAVSQLDPRQAGIPAICLSMINSGVARHLASLAGEVQRPAAGV